jgi:hypothetical protein
MTSDKMPSADPRAEGHGDHVRVAVKLTGVSFAALEEACTLTGDSMTDAINRALQIYAFVVEATNRDEEIFVRTNDGKFEKIDLP